MLVEFESCVDTVFVIWIRKILAHWERLDIMLDLLQVVTVR